VEQLRMNRKADANMWWIIIGAVIALVVMIILMVMFTGKSGKLEGGLLDCQSKGGSCLSSCPENTLESVAFSCSGSDQKCCLSSLKKTGASCDTNAECINGVCTKVGSGMKGTCS